MAHNVSAFDTALVLRILPKWHRMVSDIKNNPGILSVKIFNDYAKISEAKAVPHYVNFRCGVSHIISRVGKIGTTYGLQKEILLRGIIHDEVSEDTWQNQTDKWTDYIKNYVLSTAFGYARLRKRKNKLTGFGIKSKFGFTTVRLENF